MTRLLEQAFEVLGLMPPEAQDDIARPLLGMAGSGAPDDIEPEHLAAVAEGMAQAERGQFAPGGARDIVSAAFRRHER